MRIDVLKGHDLCLDLTRTPVQDQLAHVLNLVLSSQEDQHVSTTLRLVNLEDRHQGCIYVALLGGSSVEDLYRKLSALPRLARSLKKYIGRNAIDFSHRIYKQYTLDLYNQYRGNKPLKLEGQF